MADHYPLPGELDDAVTTIINLIADPGDPANAVFVISQTLGRAYNLGHKQAMNQQLRLRWNESRLEKKLAEKNMTPNQEETTP